MDGAFPAPLVEAGWLADHLGADDLKVIDGSWRMPGGGNARKDHDARHIPGAVFFPIDEIADPAVDLPHMLPSSGTFEAAVGALGIGERDPVVVYDDQGVFSAARVWWTFKAMGHGPVSVLNGGLAAWKQAGGLTSAEVIAPRAARYRASISRERIADHDAVRRSLADGSAIVLDARPEGRFAGRDPEPRAGLRRGAMPGARSLPWPLLVDADGRLKSRAELAALFGARHASERSVIVTTCGSGVTAAILALGVEALGWPPARLYDGSWAEWGRQTNDPALFPATGEVACRKRST